MLIYQQFFLCSISAFTFQVSFKGPWYFSSKTGTSDCIRHSAAPKLKLLYSVLFTKYSLYNLTRRCMNYRETVCSTRPPSRRLQNSRFFSSKSVKKSVTRGVRVWCARTARASHARSVSPHSRSLFSASFHTFCLTARAYLNTQKYGLFCSLTLPGPPCYCSHTEGQLDPGWEDMRLLVNDKHQTERKT